MKSKHLICLTSRWSGTLATLAPLSEAALDRYNIYMRALVAIALGGALMLTGPSLSADGNQGCPVTDEQFFKQLSAMKDWATIYSVFKHNLCPDDGFYAEGYSDVVVVALARRWSDVGKLQGMVVRDPSFRRFVLAHIDATTDEKDLRRVLRNARTRCPPDSTCLCHEIAARTKEAIAEVK